MSAGELQRAELLEGAGGEVFGAVPRRPDPWKMWILPGPEAPGVYSEASTPMRESRHSSVSKPPVEMAMLGMSPSVWFRGKVSDLSGWGLSAQAVTLGRMTCFLQRPTWITSGTFAPSGTFSSVKLPVASVSAVAIGSPV